MTTTVQAVEAIAPVMALKWSQYIPQRPTPKQLAFLMLPHAEVLFGGAVGGGKTSSLLMGALQYADMPGYSALLLRRTYPELSKADGLIARSLAWLGGTDARWSQQEHRWTFPCGATLEFGHLQHETDVYQYYSAAYQFVGFDELTTFTETQYRYLFSRLRRPEGSAIPLRMRAGSNPGGVGHDWVKRRFLDEGKTYGRVFLPAHLHDNPYLDQVEYTKSLANLDPITRRQLLDGDWTARHGGSMFHREWFEVVDQAPAGCAWVRYWDLAATAQRPGTDPDFTAGALLGLFNGIWYVGNISRLRDRPGVVEALIAQMAALDGRRVPVYMEQEPGASGVNTIDYYRRKVLVGYTFRGVRSTGSKAERARPVSSAAEAGNIKLINGPWVGAFLDEMEAFPEGGHDDQVDAVSGAFAYFRPASGRKGGTVQSLYGPLPHGHNPLGLDMSDPRYTDRDRP